MKRNISIGVSGWSYPDWAGIVYPRPKPKGFSELAYIASFLDAVEVNMSFYRPPTPAMGEEWLRQVANNPDFRFTAKLWQRFTHEQRSPWTPAEARLFKEGIRPLHEANRLGALLMQFPWSFRPTPENRDRLNRLADEFHDLPCAVEVRHTAWHTPENRNSFREWGLNFCNIDQPAGRDNIGMTNTATGPVAYYRFHGRNSSAWFDREADRNDRYNYLYTDSELAQWVTNITAIVAQVEQVFAMTNNHYRGQAVVNALQLKAQITKEKVNAPHSLVSAYPVLRPIVYPPVGQAQLF